MCVGVKAQEWSTIPSIQLNVLGNMSRRSDHCRLSITVTNSGGGIAWIDPVMLDQWGRCLFSDSNGARIRFKGDSMLGTYPEMADTPVPLLGESIYGGFRDFTLINPPSKGVYVTFLCSYSNPGKVKGIWTGNLRSNLIRLR